MAEVLIALLLIGIVASFTIPKVLQTQANQHKKAVFKETIAILSNITYQYCLNPEPQKKFFDYFNEHINSIKACDSDSFAQGCYHWSQAPGSEMEEPGFILPNGACISGFGSNHNAFTIDQVGAEGTFIDYNCKAGPDQAGQDILAVVVNLDETTAFDVERCKVRTSPTSQPASIALFNSLF